MMFVDTVSMGTRSADSFTETVDNCRRALADNGFGILAEFDFQAILLERTGKDVGPYLVLAACHPETAVTAIEAAPSIGVLLPCSVAIYERDGAVIARTVKPKSQMTVLDRDELDAAAEDIDERLHRVLQAVGVVAEPA